MRYRSPPRSACGAPPQGGAASGPAKPVPRRPRDAGPHRVEQGASDLSEIVA
jgi:hypothetical protein